MKKKYILITILLLLQTIVFVWFNNQFIEVTKYDIYSKKVNQDLTIVHISDLHNTSFGKNNYRLINKIKKSHPDIITITGDLIDANHTDVDVAIKLIENIISIAPIYYVTGNHEAWAIDEYQELKTRMEDLGVIVLDNKSVNVMIDDTEITINGIDDANMINVRNELDKLHYASDNFVLLLSHRPELFEEYINRGIDLVLSGHAHGGQFRIPIIGGLVAPNQGLFPEYTAGLFESPDATKMIISRGLGNSIIPIRINNNPELVVIAIRPINKKNQIK